MSKIGDMAYIDHLPALHRVYERAVMEPIKSTPEDPLLEPTIRREIWQLIKPIGYVSGLYVRVG